MNGLFLLSLSMLFAAGFFSFRLRMSILSARKGGNFGTNGYGFEQLCIGGVIVSSNGEKISAIYGKRVD